MKHGDMYMAKDGRELMAVDAPRNVCRPEGFLACELGDPLMHESSNALCREMTLNDPPCGRNIIFVNKEKYLTYKLLGTAESSS